MARRFDLVAYLKLFLFPLVFTAIADSAAGYLIVSMPGSVRLQSLGWLALCSSGLYFFGMAMNDIADRERDRTLAPNRVLPSGRLSLVQARVAAGVVLSASFAGLLLCSPTFHIDRLIVWAVIVGAIVAYDFFLKMPPVMGVVRMCNFMLGLVAGGRFEQDGPPLWFGIAYALPHFVYVSALTHVSTLEEGELNRGRLKVGAGVMIGAALVAPVWLKILDESYRFLHHRPSGEIYIPVLGSVIAGLLAVWIAFRAWKARDRKGVMLFVRDGIGGLIFLNATLLSSSGPDLWKGSLLVLALVIPAILSVVIFKRLA